MTPDHMKPLVDAVKKHASEHYIADGWDYVVEAMSDDEIAEILREPLSGVPATTPAEAIAAVGEVAKLLDDRRRDIRATAW